MKKLLAPILCAFLIIQLCSCSFITINHPDEETSDTAETTDGGRPDPASDAKKTARDAAAARVASLPEHTFSKDSFTVAVTPDENFIPDEPLDGYDDALVERAKIAGEKYGVDFGQFESPLELMISDSYSNYLSGIYYADAMLIPQNAVSEFVDKGHLLNSQSIPYIDYSSEWFDSDAMAQSNVGYTAPAIIGAATCDPGSYYCVYVNTALIGAAEFDAVCASVRAGEWTWQKLIDAERAARGVNGDIRPVGATDSSIFAASVYTSGGRSFLGARFGSLPYAAFNAENSAFAVNALQSLCYDGAIFDATVPSGSALEEFRSGKCLFYVDTVENMSEVTKMGVDWCVLPMPKADAAQESYASCCSANAPVLVVNAVGSDPEDAAFALDALNAASYKYTDICYADRVIRTALNGERTLEMLDYVCGAKSGKGIYDLCEMYGARFPELLSSTRAALWTVSAGGGDINAAASAAQSVVDSRLRALYPAE